MKIYRFLMGLGVGFLVSLPAAQAEIDTGIIGRSLQDSELSGIRGKFVAGSNIVYFGVQMQSQWQLSSGAMQEMAMQVDFDMRQVQNNFQPTITVYRKADIGELLPSPPGPTPLADVTNEGLDDVNGVMQNIQVAGDGNSVGNDVVWEITDQPISSLPIDSDLVQVTSNGVEARQNIATGAVTEVVVAASTLGYSVEVPGVGRVVQSIQGGGNLGNGMLQSTQLSSNLNQVMNQIRLQVQINPQSLQISQTNIHSALQSLRGLR